MIMIFFTIFEEDDEESEIHTEVEMETNSHECISASWRIMIDA